jgi:hypothetical protein
MKARLEERLKKADALERELHEKVKAAFDAEKAALAEKERVQERMDALSAEVEALVRARVRTYTALALRFARGALTVASPEGFGTGAKGGGRPAGGQGGARGGAGRASGGLGGARGGDGAQGAGGGAGAARAARQAAAGEQRGRRMNTPPTPLFGTTLTHTPRWRLGVRSATWQSRAQGVRRCREQQRLDPP